DRVEALVAAIGEPGEAERIVHERQRRGEIIDGFGHPLYPEGDPRGATLVELARELAPPPGPARTCLELVDAMQQGGGGAPTVDTGLVALALALELPPGSAGGLFSVARSAGWVAHILEQYAAGYLVRPRARYLGPDCDLAMD
ncbi:MAG: citrate synthase, partial [Deltaproteobacteria bacterium]|nr:citrate synthase [Deltaproteobacteria bacterium]